MLEQHCAWSLEIGTTGLHLQTGVTKGDLPSHGYTKWTGRLRDLSLCCTSTCSPSVKGRVKSPAVVPPEVRPTEGRTLMAAGGTKMLNAAGDPKGGPYEFGVLLVEWKFC